MWVPHQASCLIQWTRRRNKLTDTHSKGIRIIFLGGKLAEAWCWPPTSIYWRDTPSRSYAFIAYTGSSGYKFHARCRTVFSTFLGSAVQFYIKLYYLLSFRLQSLQSDTVQCSTTYLSLRSSRSGSNTEISGKPHCLSDVIYGEHGDSGSLLGCTNFFSDYSTYRSALWNHRRISIRRHIQFASIARSGNVLFSRKLFIHYYFYGCFPIQNHILWLFSAGNRWVAVGTVGSVDESEWRGNPTGNKRQSFCVTHALFGSNIKILNKETACSVPLQCCGEKSTHTRYKFPKTEPRSINLKYFVNICML